MNMKKRKEDQNGPECLWRDGEHEPEESPEEWIDRVGDEVEEKKAPDAGAREARLHAMCMIGERGPTITRTEQQAGDGKKIKTSCA